MTEQPDDDSELIHSLNEDCMWHVADRLATLRRERDSARLHISELYIERDTAIAERDEAQEWTRKRAMVASERDIARRERDEARAALEPFARIADNYDGGIWTNDNEVNVINAKLGDCRRARAARGEKG